MIAEVKSRDAKLARRSDSIKVSCGGVGPESSGGLAGRTGTVCLERFLHTIITCTHPASETPSADLDTGRARVNAFSDSFPAGAPHGARARSGSAAAERGARDMVSALSLDEDTAVTM
jgi:hypothetical protein